MLQLLHHLIAILQLNLVLPDLLPQQLHVLSQLFVLLEQLIGL